MVDYSTQPRLRTPRLRRGFFFRFVLFRLLASMPDNATQSRTAAMALLVHKEFADELAAGADAAVEEALDTQLPDAVDAVLGAKLLAFFAALPTADPEEEGALWNDAGTLKISAGASE